MAGLQKVLEILPVRHFACPVSDCPARREIRAGQGPAGERRLPAGSARKRTGLHNLLREGQHFIAKQQRRLCGGRSGVNHQFHVAPLIGVDRLVAMIEIVHAGNEVIADQVARHKRLRVGVDIQDVGVVGNLQLPLIDVAMPFARVPFWSYIAMVDINWR